MKTLFYVLVGSMALGLLQAGAADNLSASGFYTVTTADGRKFAELELRVLKENRQELPHDLGRGWVYGGHCLVQPSKGGLASRWSTNTCLGLTEYLDQTVVFGRTSTFDLILDKNTWAGWLIPKKAPQECFFVRRTPVNSLVEPRGSANGSQPIQPVTNRTSPATGSRR